MGKGSTETTTNTLGRGDTQHIQSGRDAGAATASQALNGGPWAQGMDPLSQQAIDQYGQQYGQYGQLAGNYNAMAQNALGQAGQTGLGGLGGYMNPMLQQYFQGMDPMYQRAYDQSALHARQQATGAGQAFGQNSRSGLMEGEATGNVQRQQMADYGNVQYQTGRDAAGMLMGDRARLGQLGMGMGGMGMNAMGAQNTLTGQQAQMGDYRRNVDQQVAQDPYMRHAAAQQAWNTSYGKDQVQRTTSEKSGSLLNDALSIGGMAASFLVPGAGGALGMLGSTGGGQQPNYNVQNPQSNIWNYGGGIDYGQFGNQNTGRP